MSRTTLALLAAVAAAVALIACAVGGLLVIGLLDAPQSASASADADARISVSTRCLIGCGVSDLSVAQEQRQEQRQEKRESDGPFTTAVIFVLGFLVVGGALFLLRSGGEPERYGA
ncbi:MAG: hypothetical protein MUC51_12300 [Anaerolineae bacterium]|nr:hypothetical protein [Anaerolineae bacterium]